jgi:hypothetical protein
VDLQLLADLGWSLLGGLIAGTSLPIRARMTTEGGAAGELRLQGRRLVGGAGELVAVCEVPATSSALVNLLLWLPTTAWARLPAEFELIVDGKRASE